ncbi:Lactose permease [Serratia plymuthica]|nr:Lactose permease [Serratia plymuthica]
MKLTQLSAQERHNFIYFMLFFFFYYFIMSAYFPFFPIWLSDVNHLTKTETGMVFSFIALFAIIFQVAFGLISDKLGLRKHLLWAIVILLILFAPFFIYVLAPLLQYNIYAGALAGAFTWGLCSPAARGLWKPILNASAAPTVLNTARFAFPAAWAGPFARR